MANPIRILFTIPNFVTAGSGRVMLNILRRLDPSKFQPVVCVHRRGGSMEQEVVENGYQLVESPTTVPPKPYITLPYRVLKLARSFRPLRCDLWHSFHYTDDYTEPLIARLSGAKGWIYTKKAMGWGSRAWYLRSYFSTRIVADNTDMPRVMFDHIGLRSKVQVIHHGIPLNEYRRGIGGGLRLREAFSIPAGEALVGCVAHLVPVKGHPTLLDAFAQTRGAHLFLAGKPLDKEYVTALHAKVDALGLGSRVHFLGGVDTVPALLNQLDIAVLPTWARWRMEGCPVSLLEAMGCGCPCIATSIPGSKDIIEDGKSGILVPPEDPKKLSEALTRLLGDAVLRDALGNAARQRVVDWFSVEREAAAHEALYSSIAG